jgi:alkanesulfonate monooxygenase
MSETWRSGNSADLDYTLKMRRDPGIRFHWSPCRDEDLHDAGRLLDICQQAESAGIDSIRVPIANALPEALAVAVLAGRETAHVRFRIGWDFSEVLASLTGRDLKNASDALGDRLNVHMRLGEEETEAHGDLRSAGEFIENCRALFRESAVPQFDVEGETAGAAFLAIKHADCLWRLPDRPKQVYADALPVLHFGKEVGLVASVIARDTREKALDAAAILLPQDADSDAANWITSFLWTGVVPRFERKISALVGSFDEVARAIHEFQNHGISQFLIGEWPGTQQMRCFGAHILPLVREFESGRNAD